MTDQKNRRRREKPRGEHTIIKAFVVMILFFTGTCSIIAVDTICLEATGQGGQLVPENIFQGFN